MSVNVATNAAVAQAVRKCEDEVHAAFANLIQLIGLKDALLAVERAEHRAYKTHRHLIPTTWILPK